MWYGIPRCYYRRGHTLYLNPAGFRRRRSSTPSRRYVRGVFPSSLRVPPIEFRFYLLLKGSLKDVWGFVCGRTHTYIHTYTRVYRGEKINLSRAFHCRGRGCPGWTFVSIGNPRGCSTSVTEESSSLLAKITLDNVIRGVSFVANRHRKTAVEIFLLRKLTASSITCVRKTRILRLVFSYFY